jgi:broad specificity phosphatase PhoE
MGKLYIARHGQDEDNANGILNGRRDKPLTPLGRYEAAQLALKLRNREIDSIFHSPLLRAAETASIIALGIGVSSLISEPLLMERDYGDFTGRKLKEIPQFHSDFIWGKVYQFFLDGIGVETYPLAFERAQKFLKNHSLSFLGRNTLVVCHHDIGLMIWAAVSGISWNQALQTVNFKNCDILGG